MSDFENYTQENINLDVKILRIDKKNRNCEHLEFFCVFILYFLVNNFKIIFVYFLTTIFKIKN